MDEWINSMWYICTVEYYSPIKNENQPFMTTQIDLEGIILNEVIQTEKDKYHIISFLCGI